MSDLIKKAEEYAAQLVRVRDLLLENDKADVITWAQGLVMSSETDFLPDYDPKALAAALADNLCYRKALGELAYSPDEVVKSIATRALSGLLPPGEGK